MVRVRFVCVVAGMALLTATVSAFAASPTVGTFLLEVAKNRHLPAASPGDAEQSLRAAGIDLPKLALSKPLTEGDVASIARSLGLVVTTARPSEPVSTDQMGQFVGTFANDLTALGGRSENSINGNGPPREDPNPGKGKSKGFHKSPSEPL